MHVYALVLLILTLPFAQTCKADGKTYKDGEEWEPNAQFVMNCTIDGKTGWHTNIVACLTETKKRVKVNETITEGERPGYMQLSVGSRGPAYNRVLLYTCASGPTGGAYLKIKTKVAVDTTQG
uniref:Abnormal cell migration protein 18-like fibronectin type I domain-containing protein n=1 Tax=Plectus sambesii TaxID=2011161 RepID=A0A914WSI8_9BILA